MKRIRKLLRFIILLLIVFLVLDRQFIKPQRGARLREQLYQYMLQEENQVEVFNTAVGLNGGKTQNTCVYFVSEALRRNDVPVSEATCNTSQLISVLKERRWKKDKNYKNLKPGDIVFTTDAAGNKNGIPTHAYIFMGWVDQGSYDYAYICDNQANNYEGKIYHIRNIKKSDEIDGAVKEAFSFFMRP